MPQMQNIARLTRFFRVLDALDKLKSLLKGTLNRQTELALNRALPKRSEGYGTLTA